MSLVIIGDIGGTNSRFQLLQFTGNEYTLIRMEILSTKGFKSFIDCCRAFIQDQEGIKVGVFGVAGPVNNNTCAVTNAGWKSTPTGDDVQQALGIQKVLFFNDFVIAGYGILELQDDETVDVKAGTAQEGQPIVVMGPGTGVGVCYLTSINGEYVCWASEGGHSEYFPRTEDDRYIKEYLVKRLEEGDEYDHFKPLDHPTVEMTVAGVGIYQIYPALREHYPDLRNAMFDETFDGMLRDKTTNDEIWEGRKYQSTLFMRVGFNEQDEICHKGVNAFMRILGYAVGNLIATFLPKGGVYIIGGIAQKHAEFFEGNEQFLRGVRSKPRHINDAIDDIPIKCVKEVEIGIKGAIFLVKRELAKLD